MADTLVRKVMLQIQGDDMDAQEKLSAIAAKAEELKELDPSLSVRIDTAAASAKMTVFRQELKDATAPVTATVEVDDAPAVAGIDDLKAKVDGLKAMAATIKVSTDDRDAYAELLRYQVKLDEIGSKVENPKIDDSGVLKAQADVAALDAALDKFSAKDAKAKAGVDDTDAVAKTYAASAKLDEFGRKRETATLDVNTNGLDAGLLALMKWPAIIAGIGALLPVIPAGLAAVGAAGGVAALAIGSVTKALSDASAASAASGQSSAQLAQTEQSNAQAIASAQQAIADAKTQSAHDQVTSDQQVASAEQSLADAQTTVAHDQITSAQQVASAQQSLADAVRSAAQQQVTSAQQVASSAESLRTAQQSQANAQQALTLAQQQGVLTLQQLNDQQVDGALQAQRAILNLEQAQADQATTDASATSTALDKAEAAQTVAEAQQALTEANQNAANSTNQANTANQEGVNGLPAVVSAQQAYQQAVQGTADAQASLANAVQQAAQQQQSSAEAVANAQTSLASAQQQQAWQAQKDAESVAGAQQAVANASQQAAWTQQKDAEAVANAVQNLANTYKQQQLAAAATAASSGNAAASFQKDMAGMSLAGQGVVDQLLEMKKDLLPLENTADTAVMPGVLVFLQGVQGLLPLVSGEVKTMGGILSQAFSDTGKALESSGVKSELKEIFDEGNQLMQVLLPAVGGVVSAFLQMGSQSGGAVSGFGQGIASILGGVSQLFQELARYSPGIGLFFTEIGKVVGDLGGPLGALIGAIATGLGPVLQSLEPVVAHIADGLTRVLNAIPPPVLSAIVGAVIGWTAAQWLLNAALDANPIGLVVLAVAGLLYGIDELATHWPAVESAFETGWKNVVGWTKDGVHDILSAFDSVTGWLNSSGNDITGFFESLPGKITGWLNSTGNDLTTAGRNMVVSLYNGAVSAVGDVAGFFTGLPGQIFGWLEIVYDDMIIIGKNIITGLVNGVISMGAYLENAILSLIPAPIRSYVEEALGMASPSKVAHGWGVNIVDGLVNGLDSQQSAVRAGMARTTAAVTAGAPSVTGAAGAGGGAQKITFEFVGNANDPLWQLIKKNIRIKGGNVQVVGA